MLVEQTQKHGSHGGSQNIWPGQENLQQAKRVNTKVTLVEKQLYFLNIPISSHSKLTLLILPHCGRETENKLEYTISPSGLPSIPIHPGAHAKYFPDSQHSTHRQVVLAPPPKYVLTPPAFPHHFHYHPMYVPAYSTTGLLLWHTSKLSPYFLMHPLPIKPSLHRATRVIFKKCKSNHTSIIPLIKTLQRFPIIFWIK